MSKNTESASSLEKVIDILLEGSRAKNDQAEYLAEKGEWKPVRSIRDLKAHLMIRLREILNDFEGHRSVTPTEQREAIRHFREHVKTAAHAIETFRNSIKKAGQEITTAEVHHIEAAVPSSFTPLAGLLEQLGDLLNEDRLIDLGEEVVAGGTQRSIDGVLERIAQGCDEALRKSPRQPGRNAPLAPDGQTAERRLVERLWWTWYENVGIPDQRSGNVFEHWLEAVLQLFPNKGTKAPSLETLKQHTRAGNRGLLSEMHANCVTQLQGMAEQDPVWELPDTDEAIDYLQHSTDPPQAQRNSLIQSLRFRHRREELHRTLETAPRLKIGRPRNP